MLKKIIAMALSCALLASAGMISSASTESEYYSASASAAETEDFQVSVETTVDSTAKAEETTTTEAETTSEAEVGAAIRESLSVKVKDIINYSGGVDVYDAKGNLYRAGPGSYMWITDIDDVRQKFRVLVQDIEETNCNTLFLKYEDAKNALIVSHKGMVIGDVDFNGVINAKDLTWMKRFLIDDSWEGNKKAWYMSDIDCDGEVTKKDVEKLMNWLLCKK